MPRGPEQMERDVDALVINVDVETRQRDERKDDGDHDRPERQSGQRDRSTDERDQDGGAEHQNEDPQPAAEALLLVEVRHRPFDAGLRFSMNARTPSRKSSLV